MAGARAADAPDPWSVLVASVGPRRAVWVATALTPENLSARPADPPVFPAPPGDEHAAEGVWARLLPDCFRVVAEQSGVLTSAVGAPIDPAGLALGPDMDLRMSGAAEKFGVVLDSLRGQPGVAPDPALAWLTDYAAAEAAGMAVTVALSSPGARVDMLYVFGARATEAPAGAAKNIDGLLRAHAYGDGVSFLAQGTASNNTALSRSAWSRAASAPGEPSINAAAPAPDSNAAVVAAALDIDVQALSRLDGANRRDQGMAAAFATALWPVTWATFLDKTLNPTAAGGALPAAAREAIREHAVDHVRGRGPLPMLRVGKQPYGILPATAHGEHWQPIEGGYVDRSLAGLLARIRPLWAWGSASVPTVTSGNIEKDLPDILGQTAVSQGVRVRTALDAAASSPVGDALGAGPNTTAQRTLSYAVEALLGGEPGISVSPDALGQTARTLALPLAHDSDIMFCQQMLAGQRPHVLSVLQALLGLAEAQARHDAEQYLNRELELRLERARGILEPADIAAATDALQRMSRLAFDEPEPFRAAADRLERTVGPFDATRFMARFPIASQRPHIADSTGDVAAGVRVVAAALRAAERLAEMRSAITEIAAIDTVPERTLLLAETLDCASHRLDAWLTSLAARRLADARTRGVRGLVVGAYGWVEGIDIIPPVPDHRELPPGVDGPVFSAPHDGGYVLAPSPAHAATAAVLRGARLTHDPGDTGDAALNIDLSSTRVRAAMSVLDGIRAGQPLGALLGYRLEQWLHQRSPAGRPLDRFIYCLRSAAPLVIAKTTDRVPAGAAVPESFESMAASEVVDGVRLLELFRTDPALVVARLDQPPAAYAAYMVNWVPPTADDELPAVLAAIARLDNVHDAVADLLLAESVHQLVLGSPARAAAAMDALAGDGIPPVPDVVRTPRSGTALTHRMVVVIPDQAPAGDSGWTPTGRAVTHPALEQWAAQALGPATGIVLATDDAGTPITLAAAGISALDLVAAGNGNAGLTAFWALLQRRLPDLRGRATPPLERHAGLPADALLLSEAWTVAGCLRRLLAGCRALGPDDLLRPGEAGSANENRRRIDRADLRARAGAALSALQALIDAPVDPPSRADSYALFGVGVPADPGALPQQDFEAHVAALTVAAKQRCRSAAAVLASYDGAPPADDPRAISMLNEAIAQIFDDKLPPLQVIEPAPVVEEFAASLSAGVTVVDENRAVSDGRDVRPWLTRAARVRPSIGRYAEALMVREAIGRRVPLRVAQLPASSFGTWIGLPFGNDTAPPDVSITGLVVETSVVAEVPGRISGLVVDEWTDVVPARRAVRDPDTGEPTGARREVGTAGLAVNANGPNARAPQVLLLAVSPDGAPWSADKVAEVLRDTYELSKQRAVTLERVPLAGRLLPATYVQDWSLQGEPVLDMSRLTRESLVQSAVTRYVAEKG